MHHVLIERTDTRPRTHLELFTTAIVHNVPLPLGLLDAALFPALAVMPMANTSCHLSPAEASPNSRPAL
jgi:hypothetical protein